MPKCNILWFSYCFWQNRLVRNHCEFLIQVIMNITRTTLPCHDLHHLYMPYKHSFKKIILHIQVTFKRKRKLTRLTVFMLSNIGVGHCNTEFTNYWLAVDISIYTPVVFIQSTRKRRCKSPHSFQVNKQIH